MSSTLPIVDMGNSRVEHSIVINNLAQEVKSKLGSSICRVFTDNIKYDWGGDIVVPDVSIICGGFRTRRTVVHSVPKVVVEVLSKSTEKRDRTEKMDIYLRSGVSEYWIVDWVNRKIEIYLFEPDENDIERPYLVRTVTTDNKQDLWAVTLPMVQLDFDAVFDFSMLL